MGAIHKFDFELPLVLLEDVYQLQLSHSQHASAVVNRATEEYSARIISTKNKNQLRISIEGLSNNSLLELSEDGAKCSITKYGNTHTIPLKPDDEDRSLLAGQRTDDVIKVEPMESNEEAMKEFQNMAKEETKEVQCKEQEGQRSSKKVRKPSSRLKDQDVAVKVRNITRSPRVRVRGRRKRKGQPERAKQCHEIEDDQDNENDLSGDSETELMRADDENDISGDSETELMRKVMSKAKASGSKGKKKAVGKTLNMANEECQSNIECPATFCTFSARASVLKRHMRDKHAKDTDYADLLVRFDERVQIVMEYTGESFSCELCGAMRQGHRGMVYHLRTCHRQHQRTKPLLASHRKQTRNHPTPGQCPECHITYTNKYYHVRYQCPENPHRIKPAHCTNCGIRCLTKELLKKHMQEKHKGTRHQCPLCEASYATRSGLYCHKRRAHKIVKNVPVIPFVCDVCGMGFTFKTPYVRHMTKHSDERPCQCSVCGKCFKTVESVNRHMRTVHENAYPYQCNKCGHGVEKKQYLKSHKCGRVRRNQPQQQASEGPVEDRNMGTGDGQSCTVPTQENCQQMNSGHVTWPSGHVTPVVPTTLRVPCVSSTDAVHSHHVPYDANTM